MAGDDKPQSFLWSDATGNGATALLLLVAGWILGQLRWGYMLITGLAIAVVLLAFLACRYFYARRHPKPRPLTIDDLREQLRQFSIAMRTQAVPVDVADEKGIQRLLVLADPHRDTEIADAIVNDRLSIRQSDLTSGLASAPPIGRRPSRWQAVGQTVGLL